MPLLSLRDVCFTYGGRHLLEHISFQIERGERVGLLGRNGCGKSTLMKLINGELHADAGEIIRLEGSRIGRLIQEVPMGSTQTVNEVVSAGLGAEGKLLARHHELCILIGSGSTKAIENELHDIEQELTARGGWDLQAKVDRVLSQMNLDGEAHFAQLSSGMRRRVLLAQTLVSEPDILLLDEPTNHLDIESIGWLEDFLKSSGVTLLFVTHDRQFLRRLSTRILEIDRGKLFDAPCDYETFLKRKDDLLEAEARQAELFDKKLAQEEIWVRQGVKARRTRSEARIRELIKMRQQKAERRQRVGNVKMIVQEVERTGQLVVETKNASFSYGERPIVQDFSTMIMRGDRVGLIGRNGAGKSTLLKLLLGQLEPTSGSIKLGTRVEVAYFDQLREQLDEAKTAQENVCDGNDNLLINGQTRHVIGYLQDFLFTPERARTLVKYLSGGERNRLMLAKLLTKPSNVLVLDEPTNDLDAETLDLLEDMLAAYPGTVLLVSHDREFLNNVVTSTFVFSGDGDVREYVGGYDDWIRQRDAAQEQPTSPSLSKTPTSKPNTTTTTAPPTPAKPAAATRRLSYKEERELQSLPEKIASLEAEIEVLQSEMAQPGYFQRSKDELTAKSSRLSILGEHLNLAFSRWEELEAAASPASTASK